MKTKPTSHLSFYQQISPFDKEAQDLLEIEQVIGVLKDGEWHESDEIREKCELSEVKVESILKFLAEYGFIEINGSGRKVKVGVSLQKFLEETQTVEVEA